jgi:hypothetical protein
MLLYLHEQEAALNEVHIFGREDVEMVSYLRQHGWTDTHMPWQQLCDRAAGWDNMELLKWAHEVEDLPLSWQACWQAANRGHLRPVKYIFDRLRDGPPVDFFHGQLCVAAAKSGSVELVKFFVHNGFSLGTDVLKAALQSFSRGEFDVVKYLIESSCPTYPDAILDAVQRGKLSTVRFMHENGFPLDERAMPLALKYKKWAGEDMRQYIREQGFT